MRLHPHRRACGGKRDRLGDGVGGSPGGEAYTSLEELFWAVLPVYLAMGMTAEEFWHWEPRLAESYREAEKIRREIRYAGEWRAGIYVYKAIAACLSKDEEYPPEPLFSTMLDDEQRREEREKAAMEIAVGRFEAMAAKLNEKITADGGSGDNE